MAWTKKTKISNSFDRGRILTIDGKEILAGSDEDEILIYQAEEDRWTKKTKISA
jgi:hypothetical protein